MGQTAGVRDDPEHEEQLLGGIANAGKVTKVGPHVLRPTNPHSANIHSFLAAVRAAGFEGVPQPIGFVAGGRERLEFIEGQAPRVPYPAWARTDEALASIATLMRGMHDAARAFVPPAEGWSDEVADPVALRQAGARDAWQSIVVGHNDVCLENVVFRGGVAVGLIDFDLAAPGRPLWDLGQMVRMCVPVDEPVSSAILGWEPADLPARLRLAADAYGLDGAGRSELLEVIRHGVEHAGEFIRRRAEAGDPNFIMVWDFFGGEARWDRRREWWAEQEPHFVAAMRGA